MDSIYEAAVRRGMAKGIVGDLVDEHQHTYGPFPEHVLDIVCDEAVREGYATGFAEGKTEALWDALQHKFGPLPRQYRKRVAAARPQEIKQLIQRSYDEPSLDRVFNGRGKG